MGRLPLAVALSVLTVCASGAAADAATLTAPNIVSPSGHISCRALKYGGPGIECSASYLPEIGMLDSYLGLRPRGRSAYGERGDFPGYRARTRTLRYGDVWKRRGTRCTMHASRGLRCSNLDGHGFVLVRGGVRRF